MKIEKVLKIISENQSNLPIVLSHTKRSEYIETLRTDKLFFVSQKHQTNKHLFRRVSYKPFL